MLVYGKLESTIFAADARAAVLAALRRIECEPTGIDRHSAIVDAFIRASELAQGLADLDFDRDGYDAQSSEQLTAGALLHALGEALHRSWISEFRAIFDPKPMFHYLGELTGSAFLKIRRAEGYAHYALYPESYIASARQSGLDHRCTVIGIRSIGLGLAGVVSAVLGAKPPVSLRPLGEPFRREVRAAADLLASQMEEGDQFAIVDEGPGLSGSSFASVAAWLMSRGVAASRIHFFPSHEGEPGPAACSEIKAIWAAVHRHAARQDDVLLHPYGLRAWITAKLGMSCSSLTDVSAGEWRLITEQSSPLPPADARFERRKFIAATESGEWFVKFAGLGQLGLHKYEDTCLLAAAGFVPDAPAICHGFIAQRWIAQQRAPSGARQPPVERMADYIAFRSRHFPAAEPGASLEELAEMAVHNTREALDLKSAAKLEALLVEAQPLKHTLRPVRTDGRLHAWEWLWSSAGVLKADAVDHCRGHDLVGCQDILWDIAGAAVEHDLSRHEICGLYNRLRPQEPNDQGALLEAFVCCYLAFQLGLWSTATFSSSEAKAQAVVYAQKLAHHLERRD
jgi:hypothetical protein